MGKAFINEQVEFDFRKLFESFPGMHLILTSDFKIIDASNEYLKIINSTKKKILGKSIFSILHETSIHPNEDIILNLTSSLKRVLKNKVEDSIIIKNINTSNQHKISLSTLCWKITHYPIQLNDTDVDYILHKVEKINKDAIEIDCISEATFHGQIKEVKILLVDDREDNLVSLQEILSKDNYTFKKAKSGTEALKILLHEFDFTLIIMDVQMPIINGIETASLIYEREKLKHIPIIFITAADYSESLIFQGYKTGGVDYIYKPINPALLRAKVAVFVDLFWKNHLLLAQEQKLKKAAELLKDKNALLENSNSELEAFSYSISHDLRAPLRAITGYSTILLEDYAKTLDEKGMKSLNQITGNTKKMSHLIDDLLRLSLVSRTELTKHVINTNSLINAILIDLKNLIKDRDIEFKISQLQPAMADENLIKQVWFNLISNALKYTQQKPKASIEIDSKKTENETIYYIKDNGVGFDMKYIDKVFTVFQRLHSSKDFDGSGVGLAIANRIIKKHGGKIWADSTVNNGATFYFSLPKD